MDKNLCLKMTDILSKLLFTQVSIAGDASEYNTLSFRTIFIEVHLEEVYTRRH